MTLYFDYVLLILKSNDEAGNPNDYNGNQHGQLSQGQDNAKVIKNSIWKIIILFIFLLLFLFIYLLKFSFFFFRLAWENAKRKRTTRTALKAETNRERKSSCWSKKTNRIAKKTTTGSLNKVILVLINNVGLFRGDIRCWILTHKQFNMRLL